MKGIYRFHIVVAFIVVLIFSLILSLFCLKGLSESKTTTEAEQEEVYEVVFIIKRDKVHKVRCLLLICWRKYQYQGTTYEKI